MIKTLQFLIYFLLLPTTIFSQNQWIEVHSFNTNVGGILLLDNSIYAGLDHSYLCKSNNGGVSWDTLNVDNLLCVDNNNGGNIFVGREESIVSISSDNGSTWNNVNIPIYSIRNFLFHSSGQILAGGNGGIIISNDSGNHWQLQNDGLTNSGVFCFVELDDGSVLASVNIKGIYKRKSGDTSWVKIDNSTFPSSGDVYALIKNSQNVIYAGTNSGLYKSEDDGNTWEIIDGYDNINSLCIDDSDNIFCALAQRPDGVVQLTNTLSWISLQYNLSNADVRSLFYANDGTLYCGTYSGNLYKLSLTTTDINENINHAIYFELRQNYPNPFNPSTQIRYSIPIPEFVSLKVYDTSGKEVTTLVNEKKISGTYEIEFSANGGSASGGNVYNLSSGVYFYQLKAGDFIETRKMILLK